MGEISSWEDIENDRKWKNMCVEWMLMFRYVINEIYINFRIF